MPQMAPISWLSLFFLFSIVFIVFNVMNYFCYLPKSPLQENSKKNFSTNSLNWKW